MSVPRQRREPRPPRLRLAVAQHGAQRGGPGAVPHPHLVREAQVRGGGAAPARGGRQDGGRQDRDVLRAAVGSPGDGHGQGPLEVGVSGRRAWRQLDACQRDPPDRQVRPEGSAGRDALGPLPVLAESALEDTQGPVAVPAVDSASLPVPQPAGAVCCRPAHRRHGPPVHRRAHCCPAPAGAFEVGRPALKPPGAIQDPVALGAGQLACVAEDGRLPPAADERAVWVGRPDRTPGRSARDVVPPLRQ
mmetsp:Transcript_46014/g.144177  ORF Transcript_46014/g.144177 Transcript_46014/m.144177 type:complete len:247 (-) Transcript_46014:295-1035(-)